MEVFFEYRAENQSGQSDEWIRIREEGSAVPSEDVYSEELNVPAVTCVKQYPSNYPIICLVPADRGRPMGDVYHRVNDLFFIIFMNRERNLRIVSNNEMPISEAYKIICKYRNTKFPLLVRLLARKGAPFYIQSSWRP